MIDSDLPAHPRREERTEGHPEGVLHLGAEHNGRSLGQREYKWTDDNRGKHGRARVQIVEDTQAFGRRQVDTDFFDRLTDRGGEQISVAGFATAAGEGDLT